MGNKEEYNEEPVYFCRHCLSLKIKSVPSFNHTEYCEDCGSTSIDSANIFKWEELYKCKYGKKYINYDKAGECKKADL